MGEKTVFAAVTCALAVSFTAVAQPTPALLSVARVIVKPERAAEWREIEVKYTEAYKKGGGTLRVVYQSTEGNPYEYTVITALPGYAAMDGTSPYVKGSSEAAIAGLSARRNQCIMSVRTTMERPLPDLAIMTPGSEPPKRRRVVRTTVRPGMMDQYLEVLKNELVPALKKGGVKWFRARVVEYGGSRNQVTTGSGFNDWAEMDGPSVLEKALGKDAAAAWLKKISGMISSSEYLIYTYRPELSYVAPQ